jgi:hemerythrin
MPKLLTWREDWSLGIDLLDADHRALIGRLADICLHFCPQAGGGLRPLPWLYPPAPSSRQGADLIGALTRLGDEANAHFRREESFMRAIGYERLDEHEAEHARMTETYGEILDDLRAQGVRALNDQIRESVSEWLLDHIVGGDRAFASAYFRLCGTDNPSDAPTLAVPRRIQARLPAARFGKGSEPSEGSARMQQTAEP